MTASLTALAVGLVFVFLSPINADFLVLGALALIASIWAEETNSPGTKQDTNPVQFIADQE